MWQKSRETQRSHKLVSFCSLLIPYAAELCQVPTAATATENEKFECFELATGQLKTV